MDKFLNKVTVGDCAELMKELPDESIDCIISDIPYGVNKKEFIDKFDFSLLKTFYRILKDGSAIFLWYSTFKIGELQEELIKIFNLKNIICEQRRNFITSTWDKDCLQFQWQPIFFAIKGKKARISTTKRNYDVKFKGDIISITLPQTNFKGNLYRQHPTQKSVESCEMLLKLQTNENDIVLDPFIGSGTTAVACKQLNRQFIGFEISQEYVDIANKRISQKLG